MDTVDSAEEKPFAQVILGKLEIGIGLAMLAYAALNWLLRGTPYWFDSPLWAGLIPLLASFTSAMFIGAGLGLLRLNRQAYLLHAPLALWLIIVFLAFL